MNFQYLSQRRFDYMSTSLIPAVFTIARSCNRTRLLLICLKYFKTFLFFFILILIVTFNFFVSKKYVYLDLCSKWTWREILNSLTSQFNVFRHVRLMERWIHWLIARVSNILPYVEDGEFHVMILSETFMKWTSQKLNFKWVLIHVKLTLTKIACVIQIIFRKAQKQRILKKILNLFRLYGWSLF